MKNHQLHNDSEFDQLLDRAVASYSNAEPRPGLELRVMNTLAATCDPKTPHLKPARFWWLGTASIAFALAIAIAMWISIHRPAAAPQSAHNKFASESVPGQIRSQQQRAKVEAAPSRVSFRRVRTSDANTPATVRETKALKPTEQEILLLQIVEKGNGNALALPPSQQDPLTAMSLLPIESKPIQIQPLSTEPISIAPIRIAALQPISNPAE